MTHQSYKDDEELESVSNIIKSGQLCPNNQNMLDYIRRKYISIAKAKPDSIWIDDIRTFSERAPRNFSERF